MARRISKHATRISLISDAGTKHVDTYPTGGVAYGSLSMTNVSNALIRKIKNEDVHGTRYSDEARLGISDPRTILVKADTVGVRKYANTLSVRMPLHELLHASSDGASAETVRLWHHPEPVGSSSPGLRSEVSVAVAQRRLVGGQTSNLPLGAG